MILHPSLNMDMEKRLERLGRLIAHWTYFIAPPERSKAISAQEGFGVGTNLIVTVQPDSNGTVSGFTLEIGYSRSWTVAQSSIVPYYFSSTWNSATSRLARGRAETLRASRVSAYD